MQFETFWSDTLATILGGIILTILFFLLKEKIFSFPKITGRWYFKMHIKNTAYKPYENMVLEYVAMLWREGNIIKGTVEKIYEKSSKGEQEFVGKNRTRGNIEGYIEKNYITKDRLFLHIIEDGYERKSTHFYELAFQSNKNMLGKFYSTVADQDGTALWQRNKF